MISFYQNKIKDLVFVYQYYQVIRYLVNFLATMIMVKSTLGSQSLGHFEIIVFIATTLSFFLASGLKNAMLVYYPQLPPDKRQPFLGQLFLILTALGFVFGSILWFFPHWINLIFAGENIIPYLQFGAVYLLFLFPLVMVENIFYLKKDHKSLWAYSHWNHLGFLAVTLIIAMTQPNLASFIFGIVAWTFLRWLYLFFIVLKMDIWYFDIRSIQIFLMFSSPMILNMFLGGAMEAIDGLFVTHYFDATNFVIFKYGARELPFSSLLFSTLSAAMMPILIESQFSSAELRKKVTKLMHFLFPISLVLMIISPWFFGAIYSAEFKTSAYIFNIYLLILTSRVLMPQTFLLAKNQHFPVIVSSIIEIMANVILSWWWLQYWGINGLTMATVVAYFIQKIILVWYNERHNQIKLNDYLDIKWYGIYTILLIAAFLISFKLYL